MKATMTREDISLRGSDQMSSSMICKRCSGKEGGAIISCRATRGIERRKGLDTEMMVVRVFPDPFLHTMYDCSALIQVILHTPLGRDG
jgi:hypothetical protein